MMVRKSHAPTLVYAMAIFSFVSCSLLDAETPRIETTDVSVNIVAISTRNLTHSTQAAQVNAQLVIRPISQLSDPALIKQQLSFVGGGAGGPPGPYAESNCNVVELEDVSLYISGIYSTADQYKEVPFWGTKYTKCKDSIAIGDMVYFVARGFMLDETVRFDIAGPKRQESYESKVSRVTQVGNLLSQGVGTIDQFNGAELAWIPTSATGAGDYVVTIEGSLHSLTLSFNVRESVAPNVGANFGTEGMPLVLTKGESIHTVFTGFQPNQNVEVLLFTGSRLYNYLLPNLPEIDTSSGSPIVLPGSQGMSYCEQLGTNFNSEEQQQGFFEIATDMNGEAVIDIQWPSDLQSGYYSLLVPDTIPDSTLIDGPALYAISFCVDLEH